MRKLLAVLMLALAAPAAGQQDSTLVSDKQIRQRLDWAIAQLQNAQSADEAQMAHLLKLWDDVNARIVADSLAQLPPPQRTAEVTYTVPDSAAGRLRIWVTVYDSTGAPEDSVTVYFAILEGTGGLTASMLQYDSATTASNGQADRMWYVSDGQNAAEVVVDTLAPVRLDYFRPLPPDTTTPPPPPPPPPPSAEPHMEWHWVDYRTHYLNYFNNSTAARDSERVWVAERVSALTGGAAAAYAAIDSTIWQTQYDINLWHSAVNGSPWANLPESAFIHVNGQRFVNQQFAGRDYWFANLADSTFRAWRRQRTANLGLAPFGGVFFDVMHESASNSSRSLVFPNDEYPSWSAWVADFREVIAEQAAIVRARGQVITLNPAQYLNKDGNLQNAIVAGAVMCEFCNSMYRSQLYWSEIDQLVSNGAWVIYGSALKTSRKDIPQNNATPGLYPTLKDRALLFEYASCLMVRPPVGSDGRVFCDPYMEGWNTYGLQDAWLNAFEVEIGLPLGPRRTEATGIDPLGQSYKIYARDTEHATVYIRTIPSAQNQGDGGAVSLAVSGQVLRPDGTLSSAVSSVQLRPGEAVIIVH